MSGEDMTTLQLAQLIAYVVIDVWEGPGVNTSNPAFIRCREAVLNTLRETGHWFIRVSQDADGVIDGESEPWLLPECRE